MVLAAIESSSLVASVAVWKDERILAEYSIDYKKTHSQTLLPMLEEIVRMTELDLSELDAVAVSAGPGSFTGLRIGSATAKGLGLALQIPLVEVPTLEAMAYQLYGCRMLICPMMDARRGQVYTGIYTFREDMTFEIVSPPEAVAAAGMIDRLNEMGQRVVFLGDGVPVSKELIEAKMKVPFSFAPPHLARQRAGALASLAAEYVKAGKTVSADLHTPNYLRPSQAERERAEREQAKREHAEKEKSGQISFRLMTQEDTEAVAVLEKKLFSRPWSRQALLDALARKDACYVTAVENDVPVGYCGLYLTGDEGFINQVAVEPSRQGCGIGKQMLSRLLSEAESRGMKSCSLEVRPTNERALRLYRSLDFVQEGRRPDFYEDPVEDALILWKR